MYSSLYVGIITETIVNNNFKPIYNGGKRIPKNHINIGPKSITIHGEMGIEYPIKIKKTTKKKPKKLIEANYEGI